jgi:hypothetical protein
MESLVGWLAGALVVLAAPLTWRSMHDTPRCPTCRARTVAVAEDVASRLPLVVDLWYRCPTCATTVTRTLADF